MLTVPRDSFVLKYNCQQKSRIILEEREMIQILIDILKSLLVQVAVNYIKKWRRDHEKSKEIKSKKVEEDVQETRE